MRLLLGALHGTVPGRANTGSQLSHVGVLDREAVLDRWCSSPAGLRLQDDVTRAGSAVHPSVAHLISPVARSWQTLHVRVKVTDKFIDKLIHTH